MFAFDIPGGPEILIILVILLLLFGAKRLPEMGKGLGKGIREFRDAAKSMGNDVKSGVEGDEKPHDESGPPPASKTE